MPASAEVRVEHKKLNEMTALLLFGRVFDVQLDYSCRLQSVSATAEKHVREFSVLFFFPWQILVSVAILIFNYR